MTYKLKYVFIKDWKNCKVGDVFILQGESFEYMYGKLIRFGDDEDTEITPEPYYNYVIPAEAVERNCVVMLPYGF